MKMGNAKLAIQEVPLETIEDFVDAMPTPDTLDEVIALMNISGRLVEAAAYGAASHVVEAEVVTLIRLAAQLEAQANRLRGTPLL